MKAILLQKRNELSETEWLQLVNQTRLSILRNPQEFLGNELPPKKATREAIHLVFDGFEKDIRIRKIQNFRASVPAQKKSPN